MDVYFEKKIVLVTGGSFGIGQQAALEFAKRGAKVIVCDVFEARDTLAAIEKIKGDANFIKCDVSNENEVIALINEIKAKYEKIDFAFNNAGIEGLNALTHECSLENWEKTINTNLKGIWLCMKHEISAMLENGGGAIVNNSSIAGLIGFKGMPAYVASKHGIIGLTKTAALEYAKSGIRINAVCPGVIKTPMLDRSTKKDKKQEEQYALMEPIGRLGEAAEVAQAAVWLCSQSASFITGAAIPVDGGWVAQ